MCVCVCVSVFCLFIYLFCLLLCFELVEPWISLLNVSRKENRAFLLKFGATPLLWGPRQRDQTASESAIVRKQTCWEHRPGHICPQLGSPDAEFSPCKPLPFEKCKCCASPRPQEKLPAFMVRKKGWMLKLPVQKWSLFNDCTQHWAAWNGIPEKIFKSHPWILHD